MKNTSPHKLALVNTGSLEKSKVFIEVHSFEWKTPNRISLDELIKNIKVEKIESKDVDISKNIDNDTIILDPHTLKIKVNKSVLNDSNVRHEFISKDKIDIYEQPKDVLGAPGLHLMSDSNYLYVWVGNRWKKILMSE